MPQVPSTLRYIEPAQPRLAETPPAGDGWIHEIKFDGYRTLILLEEGSARPDPARLRLVDALRPRARGGDETGCRSAILEGKIIMADYHALASSPLPSPACTPN